MDPTAMLAGGVAGIIALLIGLAIGALIGALLIMLGSRIVMGSAATFGSAILGAIASGVAGFILGLVLGVIMGMVSPGNVMLTQGVSLIGGLLITPLIYSALVKTGDGRAPNYVQGLLIYLIQLAFVVAFGALLVFVFRVPIPGVPTGF
ncbi:MAG: hypothetical protein K2P58_14015 [Hyphomonadaceae bacterium]|nr:hypothetical protein [Hyphomonadaceae bacterium]